MLRQFTSICLSIHGYIWCYACYRCASPDKCPNHSRSNVIWQLLFVHFSPLILRLRAAPNRFQCSSNYFRCSPNHSPNLSPFGRMTLFFEPFIVLRSINVLPNTTSVLTRDTMYRCCICFVAASKHCQKAGK